MTSASPYWCPHRLVVSITGPKGTFEITTKGPFARVGSDRGAEVALRDKRVPRRGLYFHATDEGVFWLDLTADESVQDVPHGWLTSSETLPLGPFRLGARLADDGLKPPASRPDLCAKQTVPLPGPCVAFILDDQVVTRSHLTRRMTLVGRRRPSNLRIRRSEVSACHMLLYWQSGVLWAIDLLSRNGTRLEGLPIQAADIPLGSSLRIGHVFVKYMGFQDAAAGEKAVAGATASVRLIAPIDTPLSAYDESETRRQSRAQERSRLSREQAERVSQWNKQVEDFQVQRVAAQAREEAWEQSRIRREAEFDARKAELEGREGRLDARQAELDAREAQLDENTSRQQAAARDLEDRQRACHDAEERVEAEAASQREQLAQIQAGRRQLQAEREELERQRAEVLQGQPAWAAEACQRHAELSRRESEIAAERTALDSRRCS